MEYQSYQLVDLHLPLVNLDLSIKKLHPKDNCMDAKGSKCSYDISPALHRSPRANLDYSKGPG